MPHIKGFDKENLKDIRADLAKAFEEMAEKYGIRMSIGNISFTPNEFSARLSAVTEFVGDTATSDIPGDVKWQKAFLRHCANYGFARSDLGRTIQYSGEPMVIVGLRAKAQLPLVLSRQNGQFLAADPVRVKKEMSGATEEAPSASSD